MTVTSLHYADDMKSNLPTPTITTTTTATFSTAAPTSAQRMARLYTVDSARRLSAEEMDRCRAERRCFNDKQVADHRPKCSLHWQPMVAAGGVVHEVVAGTENK